MVKFLSLTVPTRNMGKYQGFKGLKGGHALAKEFFLPPRCEENEVICRLNELSNLPVTVICINYALFLISNVFFRPRRFKCCLAKFKVTLPDKRVFKMRFRESGIIWLWSWSWGHVVYFPRKLMLMCRPFT